MRSPSIGRVNTTRPSLGFSFLPPPPSLALISPPPSRGSRPPGLTSDGKTIRLRQSGMGKEGVGEEGGSPRESPRGWWGGGGVGRCSPPRG